MAIIYGQGLPTLLSGAKITMNYPCQGKMLAKYSNCFKMYALFSQTRGMDWVVVGSRSSLRLEGSRPPIYDQDIPFFHLLNSKTSMVIISPRVYFPCRCQCQKMSTIQTSCNFGDFKSDGQINQSAERLKKGNNN